MENNQNTINSIAKYCLNESCAYEARPFSKYPICYKVMGKIFAQFYPEGSFYKITLKCEPDKAYLYRQLYPEIVVRGYHCPPVHQPHWNTIDLDEFSDMEMLFQMIDEAYATVVESLSKKAKRQLLTLSELEFRDTDGEDADFNKLCINLECIIDVMVQDSIQQSQYEPYHQSNRNLDVIMAYHNGVPIACGGLRMYDEDHAELIYFYVEPAYHNMGIGTELLRRLETKAKNKGYRWCIVEIVEPLKAARHVYEKAGYKIIPNDREYTNMSNTICMTRKI